MQLPTHTVYIRQVDILAKLIGGLSCSRYHMTCHLVGTEYSILYPYCVNVPYTGTKIGTGYA